jgi:hypothetical protein
MLLVRHSCERRLVERGAMSCIGNALLARLLHSLRQRRVDRDFDGATGRTASPDAGHRLAWAAMQAPMSDDQTTPESLLPYEAWTQTALRQVAVRAIAHAAEHGLPGQHHFYITFRTDHPGVVIPPRLRAQYPQEMTIVLQHQFWDLKMDEEAGLISVGLTFGGTPASLVIPLDAMTAFADPAVRFGLGFQPVMPEAEPEPVETEAAPTEGAGEPPAETPQVVSLDAFRRRPPSKP